MVAMRALVTGGAGFIGSHLADFLYSATTWNSSGIEKCEVISVDDFSTGSFENIAHLAGQKWFRSRVHSAADAGFMAPLVEWADCVFHLAATVGVFQYMQASVATVRNNTNTTDVVLELCNRYHKPVLFTSTSEVYGKGNGIPFREDDDVVIGATVKQRWGYAASKMVDEFLALAYWRQYGLPVRVVRLFKTIGPRQTGRYGMVVPRFIKAAKACRPMTVYGDGMQTRCFCSVHDVVAGLWRLMGCEAAVGKVVNLGSDQEISIEGLARHVAKAVGNNALTIEGCPNVEYTPYSEAYGPGFEDLPRRVPDLSRARELIGWAPKWTIEEILSQMVERKK